MITTLDKLKISQVGKVLSLNCEYNIKRRLLDLGLIPQTQIIPILNSPIPGLTAYQIRGTIIAIRKEDSSLINVTF